MQLQRTALCLEGVIDGLFDEESTPLSRKDVDI